MKYAVLLTCYTLIGALACNDSKEKDNDSLTAIPANWDRLETDNTLHPTDGQELVSGTDTTDGLIGDINTEVPTGTSESIPLDDGNETDVLTPTTQQTDSTSEQPTDVEIDSTLAAASDTATPTDTGVHVDSDTNSDTDTDSDTDTGNGTVQGMTLGGLCHDLILGEDTITFSLVLGEGSSQVTLSAMTGECSTNLGGTCAPIPEGPAVPVELILVTSSGSETVFTTTATIEEGLEYVFLVDLDENNEITLDESGPLLPEYRCSELECHMAMYNTRTCAPEDPCAWIDDGYCDDEACAVEHATPFNDCIDCGVSDAETCFDCYCEAEYAVCEDNNACMSLVSCLAYCEETDTDCADTCISEHSAGLDDLLAISYCLDVYCAEYE